MKSDDVFSSERVTEGVFTNDRVNVNFESEPINHVFTRRLVKEGIFTNDRAKVDIESKSENRVIARGLVKEGVFTNRLAKGGFESEPTERVFRKRLVKEGVFTNDRAKADIESKSEHRVFTRRLVKEGVFTNHLAKVATNRVFTRRLVKEDLFVNTPVATDVESLPKSTSAGWLVGAAFVGMLAIVMFAMLNGYYNRQESVSLTPVVSQYMGQVIDHTQNMPIRGAKVTVQFGDKLQVLSTNDRGQFFFKVVFHKKEVSSGLVVVEADGYTEFSQRRTVQLAGTFDAIRLVNGNSSLTDNADLPSN